MAPAGVEFEDVFSCGICTDYFVEPVTNACCGKSFCSHCLRQWIARSARTSGIPRCPAGCGEKLPYKLPATSLALKAIMEQLVPEEVKRRVEEMAEDAEEEPETCLGGFKPWQTVASVVDIAFGGAPGVKRGTSGIVIGDAEDGQHVTVKFDAREDGSELCVNVLPHALMHPLPGGLKLGQEVAAGADLVVGDSIAVDLGTAGIIHSRVDDEYLQVHFKEHESNADGLFLNVPFTMLQPLRPLVGGFSLGQKIQASMGLSVGTGVSVPFGTPGIVVSQFSDTRLTVVFDMEGNGESLSPQNRRQWLESSSYRYNVLPMEIRDFSEAPSDMLPGSKVQAKVDLMNHDSIVVKTGTQGTIVAYHDEARIVVSFDADDQGGVPAQCLAVASSCIEKTTVATD